MTPEVRQVLRARLAVARVTKGKTEAILRRTSRDGRLRGALAYWAAHTGRWGGRGFQPQNLTRPVPGVDYEQTHRELQALMLCRSMPESVEAATVYLKQICDAHGCDMGGLLSSLLRGVIVSATGKLAACDYSAVEARGLLWLAEDEEGLQVYRRFDATEDEEAKKLLHPYIVAAAEIFGVQLEEVSKDQRQVGKVSILACGYGGSVGAFEAMAATYGLDISGLDVDTIVNAFRDSRPKIAGLRKGGFTNEEGRWIVTRRGGLWKDLERTVRLAIEAPRGVFTSGRCSWRMDRGHLLCTLPSGRPLVYRDCRIEEVLNKWGDIRPTITFFGRQDGRAMWGRVETYGGKLSENITQAMTRDLMADALVKLETDPRAKTVLTVHDELLAEVSGPEGLQAMEEVMLDAPAWARGLPLAVEGHIAGRYGKA